MNVKEAVSAAKQYIQELFADETITNLGLEEVEFNESMKEWQVTIGFSRPWDRLGGLSGLATYPNQMRSYKVVRISNETKSIISVKNRETVQ